MEPVQATIRFKGDVPVKVRPLDLYGVPKQKAVSLQPDGTFAIDGTFQTYYYEVKR
jgi:hypothetical protein